MVEDSENKTNRDYKCPSCGASGVGGLEGCYALMGQVGAREFADQKFFYMHRLTVDAYCLQHPEKYMKSSKSAAAHLAAMCWSMERGQSIHMPKPLKRWVDGPRKFTRVLPPPPGKRGKITIVSVIGIDDSLEYEGRVWDWARSAWEAWAEHWGQARLWMQEAIAEYESLSQ